MLDITLKLYYYVSNKIVYLFLFFSFYSISQFSKENKQKADSLVSITRSNSNNLNVANAYLQLSELYSLIDLDSVVYFAHKAEEVAQSSLEKTEKKEQKKAFISLIAGANNNLGYAYTNKGDLSNALYYHKKALDLWKQINDNSNIGQAMNNLGVIYRKLEEYKKALTFFNAALEAYRVSGDEQPMAITYNNLGGTYKMLEQDDKAKISYDKSLKLRRKIGDDRGVASTLNNIGALFKKQGEIDSAYWYFSESLELIEQVGDKMGIAHATCNLGEIAFLRNELANATHLGQKALKIGEEHGVMYVIEQASGLLERVYKKSGQWEKAYEMQHLNLSTTLKIKSEEAQKAAMLMEMQLEFDKKKEIASINNQKNSALAKKQKQIQTTTIYFISICLILVIIFSSLLYQRFKVMQLQKGIIEKQNNERKIMLQEIHHRVKNNFQIISSLLKLQINRDQNPELVSAFQEAINRIHTMAIVHEIIYKQDVLAVVNTKEYLKNLISNLQRTFENNRISIAIDCCNDNLELDQTIPIGIIVNELITNSFKHAFNEQHHDPRISINLTKETNLFVLNYKDNGIGHTASQKENSFGIELIETVVEQISGHTEIMEDEEWKTNIKISFAQNEAS